MTGGPTDVRTLDLVIPNDVGEIERVVEMVRRECAAMRFGSHQLMLNVPVALTEALSNAILRGNGDDPRKRVHIRAYIDHSALIVEVADEGGGFDLKSCTLDPTTPEHLQNEEGRGLFLMQKLMDRVECLGHGAGSVVRMTLKRAS